jgi:hypothetical protein
MYYKSFFKHLVADATHFYFYFGFLLYIGVGASTLDIHNVCLGFALWMNLEVDLDACLLWSSVVVVIVLRLK